MILFDRVSYHYPSPTTAASALDAHATAGAAALHNLSLHIPEGELVLVVGPSGAGKSTFLRCLNGLVPHFYGGTLTGRIEVAGHDPVALSPQNMSRWVGMVFQDPESQFVADRVEDELAFAMENQALPPPLMRKRVEEVLDQLTIPHLRNRHIATLSGGEKQRVAIAAVLTMHPEVLVLDEPTSQLDPQSAEEVLVAIRRLNEDLGLTVVLAEHRLERVVQFVDRILYLPGANGQPLLASPREVMAHVPLTPPLVTLGKAMGWQPLPLTVKQARRFVARPRDTVARSTAAEQATLAGRPSPPPSPAQHQNGTRESQPLPSAALAIEGLTYRYGGRTDALRDITFSIYPGEVVAIMGRNGSGKSTLLKHLAGLLQPARGRVTLSPGLAREPVAPPLALDTRTTPTAEIIRHVGFVPQNPGALLFKDTVMDELAFTRQGHGLPPDPAADHALLAHLGLSHLASHYPRDLSAGERQRVALAAILVAEPSILLLDEPTRGLDYQQKEALARILLDLHADGRTVLLATHDVELVAQCASRVVLLAEGEVVVDGSTRDVMTGSLVFASQVNKLYRDPHYLVVQDVIRSRT